MNIRIGTALISSVALMGAIHAPVVNAVTVESFTSRTAWEYRTNLLGFKTYRYGLDFEALANGELLEPLKFYGRIQFFYNFGDDVSLMVTSAFPTSQGVNSLGTDDGGVLQDGDEMFLFPKSQVRAVGMYFISADPLLDGDISLQYASFNALLDADRPEEILGDGSKVYFLGLIRTDGYMDSWRVNTLNGGPPRGDGVFLYNIDDIINFSDVVEPGSLLLMTLGLGILVSTRRRLTQHC